MRAPLIGLTADADSERYFSRRPYADAIAVAGGVPIVLPHCPELAAEYVARCDGILLTGGDDPRMESFGSTTHPKATPVEPSRQAFELALLAALDARPSRAALGICLGMQYMALHAGGSLDQHLPETLPTHAAHWGRVTHPVEVDLGRGRVQGTVLSHHRQAVRDAGRLVVAGRAPDGVIECVRDPSRPFYLGVQWHPERTPDPTMGIDLLRALVAAAR